MLTKFFSQLTDKVGDWNPQLFREIKGKFNTRNIALVSGLSVIGQVLLYLYFKTELPYGEGQYNRYCTGDVPEYSNGTRMCLTDLLDHISIFKELWWLDIFTTMSIIGIFVLLVLGSYMLIADLTKEESRGTLNFIRLSPQSVTNIIIGKILGVPILVYLLGLIALPLHFTAGLKANIPLPFILAFYLVLAVSCIFFYSAAILFSLTTSSLSGFQAWLGSAGILGFLLIVMGVTLNSYSSFSEMSFDWLILFYPGTVLMYLVKSTFLSQDTINYLHYENLQNLSWYGQFLWQNSVTGIGFILLNYSIWTFWIWQGLKRRFHSPSATVISKYNSYWLSGCFIVFNVGFALQQTESDNLKDNFQVLQLFNLILFLILIAALSPHRQTLQDWSRYRHQNPQKTRNFWQDLILGEKSPAVLAIALNIGLVTIYTIPFVLLFPLGNYKISVLIGLIFSAVVALIYASITQLTLMLKTNKRGLIATGIIAGLVVIPFISFGIFQIDPSDLTSLWLLSAMPSLAIEYVRSIAGFLGVFLGELIIMTTLNFQITRLLNQAGKSETLSQLTESAKLIKSA